MTAPVTAAPAAAPPPTETVAVLEARLGALAGERVAAVAALTAFDDGEAGELLAAGASLEEARARREPLFQALAAADAGRRALEARLAAARAVEWERERPEREARVAALDERLDDQALAWLEAVCQATLAQARWGHAWRAASRERGVSPRWASARPTEPDAERSFRRALGLEQALVDAGAPEAIRRRAREALEPVEQLLRPAS